MYGLLGEKLGHSFSKEIHESINNYQYNLIEVSKNDIDTFLKERSFKAINVTIPYKETVIPYLYYIDPLALKIGAVNTVLNKNGNLYGYNTDYLGLKALIKKEKIVIENKKVLILGAGGTSKTAHAVVSDLKAKEVLVVSTRPNEERISYDEAKTIHSDAEVIINATPVGMYPNDDLIIDLSSFNKLESVIDVIYNPLNTSLIREAKRRNIKAVNGLYMLVAQAVYASYLFVDMEVEEEKIDEVYQKIKAQKQNVVLIGMPSCGKSHIAKILAKNLNKKYIDTDSLIEEKKGMKISSFLNKDNENEFRDIESNVIEEVSNYNGVIISTGGGVIKRDFNIDKLKKNGIIIFIDRDLQYLQATSSRPLSNKKSDLEKLYNERYNIYISCADCVIKNNDALSKTIDDILEVYYENISN